MLRYKNLDMIGRVEKLFLMKFLSMIFNSWVWRELLVVFGIFTMFCGVARGVEKMEVRVLSMPVGLADHLVAACEDPRM